MCLSCVCHVFVKAVSLTGGKTENISGRVQSTSYWYKAEGLASETLASENHKTLTAWVSPIRYILQGDIYVKSDTYFKSDTYLNTNFKCDTLLRSSLQQEDTQGDTYLVSGTCFKSLSSKKRHILQVGYKRQV